MKNAFKQKRRSPILALMIIFIFAGWTILQASEIGLSANAHSAKALESPHTATSHSKPRQKPQKKISQASPNKVKEMLANVLDNEGNDSAAAVESHRTDLQPDLPLVVRGWCRHRLLTINGRNFEPAV